MKQYYKLTQESYERTTSGKSWQSKPVEKFTEYISSEEYNNHTSEETQRFFRRLGGSETAEKCYTSQGYIITRLTSCNPEKTVKIVRNFKPLGYVTHILIDKKNGVELAKTKQEIDGLNVYCEVNKADIPTTQRKYKVIKL